MRLSFRPLGAADFPLMARWQSEPHVAAWWREPNDLASITAKYRDRVEGERTEVFVILLSNRPVGIIQRYRHADYPEWDATIGIPGAAGIDYYLGDPAIVGRGIGTDAISIFARETLARYPNLDCVVAAPQQANVASWRALEKAGFVRVWAGVLDSDDPSDEGPAFIFALPSEVGQPWTGSHS